jgi:hypothetical protein
MSEEPPRPDDPDDAPPEESLLDDVVPPPSKTPLYQAIHASRYQRQALIKEIQMSTETKLICYVAGMSAPIDREDTVGFVDLLHNLTPNQDIDLLLHTGGGDIDAAEKLVGMVRERVGTGVLRLIVPDYAKSAGTLIALGCDRIVMSDSSELGPIDPQVPRIDGNGNRMWHSVKSYLDAYDEHSKTLKQDPTNITAQLMLSKLEPETVKHFRAIMTRARDFGEKQLRRGMMKENRGNWSQAVSALLDGKQFSTHGQPISWKDASDAKIGLTVDYLPPGDPLWELYWQLYTLQLLAVGDSQKLFESDFASLCIDSRVA